MCQQCIAAIQHMSDGIPLMRPQLNVRVHADKMNVAAVIFAGTGAVEQFIILCHQCLPAFRVTPDPVPESVLDCLLFLLSEGRFLFVEDTLFIALCIFNGIVNPGVFQIQSILQNLIGVRPICTICHIGRHIMPPGTAFTGNLPFCRNRRKFHFNGTAEIEGCLKSFLHKLLDILWINPSSAQAYLNFRGFQIFGLSFFQRSHINRVLRIGLYGKPCNPQLIAHITGQIFIRSLPAKFRRFRCHGITENHASQLAGDGLEIIRFPQQFCHKRNVYLATFSDGNRQCFAGRIHMGHMTFRTDGAFGENIGFAFQISIFINILQRAEQIVGRIL